jgi:hypothetical protein
MAKSNETFSIVRIYSDANGESHFEDVEIPLKNTGKIGFLSELQSAKGIKFRTVIPSYDYELHTAPAHQYLLLLDGEIEIETSLGDVRRFRGGDVLLLEDTTGKGHRTKNVKQEIRRSVFVILA